MTKQTNKIRELNDNFRQRLHNRNFLITSGVDALDWETKWRVIQAVVSFNKFNKANDPRHEHDFGAFDIEGRRFFWKIDYYDKQNQGLSEDPANPEKTNRVLTVMLAEEY